MNEKKFLTKIFLVAIFAFAMLFSGLVFALPNNVQSVYAGSSTTIYTVTHGDPWTGDLNATFNKDDTLIISNPAQMLIYVTINGDTYDCFSSTSYTFHGVICSISTSENEISITDLKLSINYDKNGGEYATSFDEIEDIYRYNEGEPVTLKTTDKLTKVGYKFKGWALTNNATTSLTAYNASKANANSSTGVITLYAVWESLSYSDDIELTIDSLKYGIDSSAITISLNDSNLEISNYKLWHYDGQNDSYVTVNTITAPGTYTLNIIIKGKTENYYFTNTEVDALDYSGWVDIFGEIENYTFTTTNIVAVSCDITKIGTSFWGTTSSTAEENIVLGVSISLSGFSVTYDNNAGEDSVLNMPTDTNYYLEDTPVTVSTATPTRTGYKFLGWNTDSTATTKLDNYTMETDNVTFYAIWELDHKHGEILFNKELNSTFSGGALSQGNYCLTSDITLTSGIIVSVTEEVNICLNGHKLNLGGYTITNNGKLNICDCNTTKTYFEYNDEELSQTLSETDIYFEGGYITGSGQIDNREDATLTLSNIAFYNCSSESQGVLYTIGTLSTSYCQFIKCSSDGYYGGAIYINYDTAIDHCAFYACSANSGGAISVNYGDANISDCVFSYCTAACGGAIYSGYDNDLKIERCLVSHNTATESGGGLDIASDSTIIIDCTITNNSSPDGAGVQYWCYECYLGGKTIIYDNLSETQQNNLNLELYSDYIIDIYSITPLTTGSKIGITISSNTGLGTFISEQTSNSFKSYFVSDDTDCDVNAREVSGISTTYNYNIETYYSVSYDNNTDDTVTKMPENDDNSYFTDDIIIIPSSIPERVGYQFLGWNTDSTATTALTFENGKYTIETSDVTFYAIWESLAYSKTIKISISEMKYNSQKSDISISIVDGDGIVQIDSTQYGLYVKNNDNKTAVTNITTPNTYYVAFALSLLNNRYFKTINLGMMGGIVYTGNIQINDDTYGTYIWAVVACSSYDNLTGFSFVDNCESYEKDKLYIEARFALTGHSITYDDNVNDSSVNNMPTADVNTYLENAPVAVSTTNPTRTDYKFLGWNTEVDGKGTNYAAGSTYTMGTSNVTLYAIWGHEHGTVGSEDYILFDKDLALVLANQSNGSLESGNYYLSDNLTFDDHGLHINQGKTINLCLNGYVLDLNRCRIYNNGTLTIYDCGTTVRYFTDEKIVNYDGVENEYNGISNGQDGCYETYYTEIKPNSIKIIGGVVTGGWGECKNYDNYVLGDARGGAIYNDNYGELNIEGGNIVGNMACYGGAIYNEGRIYMNAGKISGNRAADFGYEDNYGYYHGSLGGGIYSYGIIFMKGGEISYNNAYQAGGIQNEWLLDIDGGTINHNEALALAGGIYNYYNGNDGIIVNFKKGDISYNKAPYGGAVCNACVFNMTGGTITHNEGIWGAAINSNGKAYLLGGSITDNIITSTGIYAEDFGGAGIDCYANNTIILGGKIVIKDNKSNGELDNICFENQYGNVVTLSLSNETPLETGAYIGIRVADTSQEFISGLLSKTLVAYFHSDDSDCYVKVIEIAGTPNTYTFYINQKHTITYDKNTTDSVTNMPDEDENLYVQGDNVIVSKTTPTRTDYKFLGWNTDSTATTALTFENGKYTIETSDVTFYAIWESLEYDKDVIITISKDLKYNVKKSDISITVDNSDLKIKEWNMFYAESEESVVAKTIVEIPGSYYIFVILEGNTENYWFGNEDGVYKHTVTVAKADAIEAYGMYYDNEGTAWISSGTNGKCLAIVAQYTLLGYSITYDDNAGGDSVLNMPTADANTYLENAPVAVSTTIPTRTGYKFLGWNTDKDATTALTFENGKYTMSNSSATFYAIWQEKTAVIITETAQTKICDGLAQNFTISGNITTGFTVQYYVDSAWTDTVPMNAGSYNVKITRAEDDTYKAYLKEIANGLIVKNLSIIPEEQQEKSTVIVTTEDGFTSDITVVVEVTVETEIEQKELSVDYYNLNDEAKLAGNEKVGIVFDIKLYRTIGENKTEIQPSDIKAGTKIKVKMLIPETVDISKVTRILHVHSAGDIEEIEFDASKVDENGYYEIEIDRLSEFAFIYQTGNQNTLIICVLGGLGLLLIVLLLALFLKKRKVIVIANEKVVKEFKFRPLQTIEFNGEFKDFNLFADRELTNAFSQQKMGFKSIAIYGKDVKPKVTKTKPAIKLTKSTTITKKTKKTIKKSKNAKTTKVSKKTKKS